MSGKSIRQFAESCGVTHPTVIRYMKNLGITGDDRGRRVGIILNDDEQAVLREAMQRPKVEAAPEAASEVTVLAPLASVGGVAPMQIRRYDGSEGRALQAAQLQQMAQQYRHNGDALGESLLAYSAEQGRQLGAAMASTKYSNAISTAAQLEAQMGEFFGAAQSPQT
jgi:hypothetical protein